MTEATPLPVRGWQASFKPLVGFSSWGPHERLADCAKEAFLQNYFFLSDRFIHLGLSFCCLVFSMHTCVCAVCLPMHMCELTFLCGVTEFCVRSQHLLWCQSILCDDSVTFMNSKNPLWCHSVLYEVTDSFMMSEILVWCLKVLCDIIESCVES